VSRLRPIAASENTRNGIMMALSRKALPAAGMRTNATAKMTAIPIRSCRIGNTAMSAA